MHMRYTYSEGIKRKNANPQIIFLAGAALLFGVYVLVLTLSPALPDITASEQQTAKKLVATKPVVGENRVYIPQINVDVPIVDINGNETAALEKGAIHRAPESGNPASGGNYVIAAHRFNLGLTPAATRAKSPFYHIDKLKTGDQLYIDYEGVRYVYEVYEKKRVAETAVDIEQKTSSTRLTLYSCELTGPKDGREAVFAKPLGVIAWESGKPAIKTAL